MKILFVGDIVGKSGRIALKNSLCVLKEKYQLDFCIGNAENSSSGSGISQKVAKELFDAGFDALTSGDHIWRNKEIFSFINSEQRILRPANFPNGSPGAGSNIFIAKNGVTVGVINLLGRVFMNPIDCPFKAVNQELEKLKNKAKVIIVDFHAEATSEKIAMGWYLDGKVTAVLGTHTHVPTADNKILTKGTAYITDVGMVGSKNSILGRDIEPVLKYFLTSLPQKFDVTENDVLIQGAVVHIDDHTYAAKDIIRVEI